MRKLISAILALVMILSLCVPALAAAEPEIVDNTAEVLASTQTALFIAIGVIVVLSAALIVVVIKKQNALKVEQIAG